MTPANEVRPGEFVMVDLSRTIEPDVAKCKVVAVSHVTTFHAPPATHVAERHDLATEPRVSHHVKFMLCPVDESGVYHFGYAPDDELEVLKQETENEK